MDEKQTATGSGVDSTRVLAFALGCKANCHFCRHAGEDRDGEHSQLFCGTTCSAGKAGDETYLEAAGVDLDSEKECWEPDFWKTPGNEFCDLIGSDGDASAAFRAFDARVATLKANTNLSDTGHASGTVYARNSGSVKP